MKCLGIESTAHTFGAGIVDSDCNVIANEKSSFATETGGLIPRELAEHHLSNAQLVIEKALEKAKIKMSDLDLVAFSIGPGIGNALSIGAVAARMLSLQQGIPLLGVNHCVAHIEIGKKKTNAENPIVVYASGANTQIIGYENRRYRIYGETLDVGIGNLLDSFGRALGLGFPAGPVIDKMYFETKDYVELPYTVKGMDLVFSGLQTAAENKIGKVNEKALAYSLMHNAFAMLTEVTERALAHAEKKEVLLTGGVAASKALQEMMGKMCEERDAKLFVCPAALACDNGAMIAWQGIVESNAGVKMEIKDSAVNPKFRTDQVEVSWI